MSDTDTTFVFDPTTQSWMVNDTISIPNRGINFGDGVFETMVYDGGQLRFIDEHQARLFLGLDTLGICKKGTDIFKLNDFLNHNYKGQKLRVRWTVFRSGLGKYTPTENDSVQYLSIESLVSPPLKKERTGISERVKLMHTKWSRCKTLNAIPYVLAALERQQQGWDEIILLDHRGKVSEAGASTIFWKNGRIFYTPSLTCGCVQGIARTVILQKIAQAGFSLVEGEFEIGELLGAEIVWTSNVTGISYLESIGSSKFSIEPIPFLQEIFD